MISNTNAKIKKILKEEITIPGNWDTIQSSIIPSQAISFIRLIGNFIQDIINIALLIIDVCLKFFDITGEDVDIWGLYKERSEKINARYENILGGIGGGRDANLFYAMSAPPAFFSFTGIRNIHGSITKGEPLFKPLFQMSDSQSSGYRTRNLSDVFKNWAYDRKKGRGYGRDKGYGDPKLKAERDRLKQELKDAKDVLKGKDSVTSKKDSLSTKKEKSSISKKNDYARDFKSWYESFAK